MECKQCGVIYRSRKHWYGNKDPEQSAVKTENKHIWTEVRMKIQLILQTRPLHITSDISP